jgi:hypothetical protein
MAALRDLALPTVTFEDLGSGPFLAICAFLQSSSSLLSVPLCLSNPFGILLIPSSNRILSLNAVSSSVTTADFSLLASIRFLPQFCALFCSFAGSYVPETVVLLHAVLAPQSEAIKGPRAHVIRGTQLCSSAPRASFRNGSISDLATPEMCETFSELSQYVTNGITSQMILCDVARAVIGRGWRRTDARERDAGAAAPNTAQATRSDFVVAIWRVTDRIVEH